MRIVFDGGCLADTPVTGVGRAFLTGLAAYVAAGCAQCVLLLPDGLTAPAIADLEIVAAPRGALRRQFELPGLLRRLAADVLHSPVAAVPLAARCAVVATVHDLPWLCAGGERDTGMRRRVATRLALRRADAVLAPSHFTADAAARLLGRSERLHVVPHGSERAATLNDPATRSGPFVCLGDDRPRKNREPLRRAHASLSSRLPDLPALRFVGPPHDYVDEATKQRLLREATAVVQPSRFEGFGLPVLEAMCAGAPLVCSDIAPFREIAEDAALWFDPDDESSIASALLQATDAARRNELAVRGFARAAAFSPAATALAWQRIHTQVGRR